MYITLDVYDTIDGNVIINNKFRKELEDELEFFVEKFIENEEDKEKYNESINKIIELLQKAGNDNELSKINCYIDRIDVDEDDIPEKDNYNEGYNDAIDKLSKKMDHLRLINSSLISKIEHKAFNFGKQDEITREDCKEILQILEAEKNIYEYD